MVQRVFSFAVLFSLLIGAAASAAEPSKKGRKKKLVPKIEVCFVLDTTGSMSGLIQGAKDKIWSIANEMLEAEVTPDIKFGLIAYRDKGDAYVTQRFRMTDDIDHIHTKLLELSANGGGDAPESVNQALHEAVSVMDWSMDRKVLKLIFLVGDAPPHMDYDEIQYPQICELGLKHDLIINTIQCGNHVGTDVVWKKIAHSSEGQYAAILQSGGTRQIHTPFDKEIAKLNGALNKTVCLYGCPTSQQKAVEGKMKAQMAANSEAVADRAAYFSKNRVVASQRGGGAGFGGQSAFSVVSGVDDLVSMIMDGKIELADIDEEKLPADLRKIKPAEREVEINARIEARRKTQATLDQLVKKRAKFISTEKAKQAKAGEVEGFDLQVRNMIRKQASRKGITYSAE